MKLTRSIPVLLAMFAAAGQPSQGQPPLARVGDVTRLQGQGTNVLIGYGLVTGLDRTGDGAKFLPTMNALAGMLQRFNVQVGSIRDVDTARNIAVVMVEVVIPEHGARAGDLLDVSVSAVAARSLEGGRLLSTPLLYQHRSVQDLFGMAQGPIELSGTVKTAGHIRNGARIERDVFMNVVVSGAEVDGAGLANPGGWIRPDRAYITLVLDDAHAGWSMAAAVAQAVDKELGISADADRVALAVDSRNVVVLLPSHQLGDPAAWIRDVLQTPLLMESNEARVTVNRNAGTIVISGDTRISPVIVSQKGMTVTVGRTPPERLPGEGVVDAAVRQDFVPVDVEAAREANVRDLLEALNRLQVPFEDRVSILEQVHRAGKLHAKLIYEGA